MFQFIGIAAACASLIVNGPRAWPVVKHAAHETVCVVKTGHKCKQDKQAKQDKSKGGESLETTTTNNQ